MYSFDDDRIPILKLDSESKFHDETLESRIQWPTAPLRIILMGKDENSFEIGFEHIHCLFP